MTLRYLMAVAAAAAAIAASLWATHHSDLPHVAKAIAAESPHKSKAPVPVRHYVAYFGRLGGRWILVERPGDSPPVYVLALGCGELARSIFNKTYTSNNNTVAVGSCAFVAPWVEPVGDRVVVTHYYATCAETDLFKPEVVEGVYVYNGTVFVLRLVVVC